MMPKLKRSKVAITRELENEFEETCVLQETKIRESGKDLGQDATAISDASSRQVGVC